MTIEFVDYQADEMVEDIKATRGGVDILVNNAGINRDRTFLKMTREMWDEVLGVNLNGPFNITHGFFVHDGGFSLVQKS